VKDTLEAFLELEMEQHLGYAKHDPEDRGSGNSRNGATPKTVRGDFGELEIETARDRNSSFEPKIVAKRKTSVGNFGEAVISLYARSMTTREIEQHVKEIYGVEISPQFVLRVTEELQQQIVEWQSRPLERVYPIVFVDGLRVAVRTDTDVLKKCVYTVLGVSLSGKQEVLGLWIEETEGARFWLKVLNDLKARGVLDVLILCGDGLTGYECCGIRIPSGRPTSLRRAPRSQCDQIRFLEGLQTTVCRYAAHLHGCDRRGRRTRTRSLRTILGSSLWFCAPVPRRAHCAGLPYGDGWI
jgi:putative transposase